LRRTALVFSVACLLAIALSAPASADHIATADPDGSNCVVGHIASGIPMDLRSDGKLKRLKKIPSLVYFNSPASIGPYGLPKSLKCEFIVPDSIAPEDNWFGDPHTWYRPAEGIRDEGVWCWAPGSTGEPHTGSPWAFTGIFVLRPNGKATLTCKWTYPAPG
jgi:hypothetical protein